MTLNNYKRLIIKELNGKTSLEESLQIDLWLNENAENQRIYNELWSAYQLTSPDNDLIITDKEVAWAKIESKIAIPRKRGLFVMQLSKFAAAAIVFFLIGIGVQYYLTNQYPSDFLNQYTCVVVPEGQKSMVLLPDGSKVWMNAGSELKYRNSFNSKVREVELEGEAFFEVAKDRFKMFKVKTGTISVEVYGTAFNVKNYKDEKRLEITVENGNVGVMESGKKLADLTKGKQASINKKTNELCLLNPNVDIVTAWKNNELVFDGTPFEEVIRYLERWYGVNINIEEEMKKKHNYTFKVKTESFRELLELLKEITPLEYKINGKNVIIKYAK